MNEFEKEVYFILENLIQNKSSDIPGMKEACEKMQIDILVPKSLNISYELFHSFKKKIMTRKFTNGDFIQYIESLKSSINNPILKPICNNLGQIVCGVFGLVNSTISKEVKNFEEFREDLKKIVDQFEENKKSIFDDNIFHSSFENIKKKNKKWIKRNNGKY